MTRCTNFQIKNLRNQVFNQKSLIKNFEHFMFEIRIINFKTSLNLPVKIDFT